jgi:hypothetical protein
MPTCAGKTTVIFKVSSRAENIWGMQWHDLSGVSPESRLLSAAGINFQEIPGEYSTTICIAKIPMGQ